MHRDDFDPGKPVTRGQWKALAEAFCRHVGEPVPDSRAAATTLLVRLAEAEPGGGDDPPIALRAGATGPHLRPVPSDDGFKDF